MLDTQGKNLNHQNRGLLRRSAGHGGGRAVRTSTSIIFKVMVFQDVMLHSLIDRSTTHLSDCGAISQKAIILTFTAVKMPNLMCITNSNTTCNNCVTLLNCWVMHPVARVSPILWLKPPCVTNIYSCSFLLCTTTTCFGPDRWPSSGKMCTKKYI
jgi:hypothetical protein